MNTAEAIELATTHLSGHIGQSFDVFTIAKPAKMAAAVNLAKIVSKLSPLVGNLIEFTAVDLLNDEPAFMALGKWKRQDPDFPDALFEGSITPPPGFEIKAWFPLATEITARFKDSQERFTGDNIHVAMLAWLPENVLFRKPTLIDVCVVSGRSVAKARDEHYHNPPDYLVLEPEDTSARTRNLRQTNTNGYKWQGTAKDFEEAKKIVASWSLQPPEMPPQDSGQIHMWLHSQKVRDDGITACMFVQLVEIILGGIGPKSLEDAEVSSACSFPDCRPPEEGLLALF